MKLGKKAIIGIMIAAVFIVVLIGGIDVIRVTAATSKDRIINGVSIDKIDISGMKKEEAETAVSDYVNGLKEKEVSFVVDKDTVTSNLGELGYSCAKNDDIEEALSLGTQGNLIKRYKEIKEIKENGKHYDLSFSFDQNKVKDLIAQECTEYDVPAVDATVSRVNGQFVYTDHQVGKKINVDKTYEAFEQALNDQIDEDKITVQAVVEDDAPTYTLDVVKQCNTLIGSYNTDFSGSSSARCGNVANAAKLINGSVVYPDQIFSCYEKMSPFTAENGYFSAPSYVNGLVEDSIGGGVCQVSSTLYNAVLLAELDVVQRAPHSMTVSYVPLAQDAAIAGTFKDLKFKNNLDVPILIESYTSGTRLYFNIYGMETRDTQNRSIKYESVMISKKEPPKDVIKKDPTQPDTYKKITQSAHSGYVAELYKVVYENGVEVSRTQVNRSTYNASPNYITVGTIKSEPEKEEEDKKDPDDKDKEDNIDDKDNKDEKDDKEDDKDDTTSKPSTEKPSTDKPVVKPETKPESDTSQKEPVEDKTETAKNDKTNKNDSKEENVDDDNSGNADDSADE